MTYIDPRGKPFAHLERLARWQRGDKAAPVTVEWDLSNACSLGCRSCHFSHTHVAGPWAVAGTDRPIGYSETGRFADPCLVTHSLKAMALAGVKAIVWSGGGEPTLHPSFADIALSASRWGLQQGLYTLGGHIQPGDLANVLRHSLSWVVVSLDCVDGLTYAAEKRVPAHRFDDACNGIRELARGPVTVGVSFLLHAENWHQADAMVALARSLGATYTTFRPTIDTAPSQPGDIRSSRAWVQDALPTIERLAAEPDVETDPARFSAYAEWAGHGYSACHGVKLLTQITPDGRVWICPNRRGVAGSELGDLRTESFHDIWARHPGQFAVDAGCRAMCRLHLVNQTLAPVFQSRKHEAFI